MRRYFPLALVLVLLLTIAAAASGGNKIEWAIKAERAGELHHLPDGSIAFTAKERVITVDRNGNVSWEWVAEDRVGHIETDEEGFLYAASGSLLTKLGKDGAELWSFDATGSIYSLRVIEGGIFVGWEYGLFKLDQDGRLVWDYYRPEDC